MKTNLRDALKKGGSKSRRTEVVNTELGYLWANLLQRGVLDTHRAIGFCAIGDEGSNLVAANLAMFLGSKGKRVALVEAALRTPALAAVFQATPTPGLADLLAGKAQMRDVLRIQVATGVDLVPAGQCTDPFWTFTGEGLRAIVGELLAGRDLCFVDVPALSAPEASLVVRNLDAIVLVVEANRHHAEVVRRNLTYLRSLGTPVLGSVANELVHEVPTLLQKLL